MPIPPRTEPWVPVFEDQGIELFVENLLEVFQRDQTAALLAASRDGDLPEFRVFNNSHRHNTVWPVLAVVAHDELNQNQTGLYLAPNYAVTVEVEDTGPEPNQLARNIMRRARAVRAMLYAARTVDILAGFNLAGVATLDIGKTSYTAFSNANQTQYKLFADIPVTLELLET